VVVVTEVGVVDALVVVTEVGVVDVVVVVLFDISQLSFRNPVCEIYTCKLW